MKTSTRLVAFVFSLAGRVPARGELIEHPSGIQFEVLDADPRRIRRLRIHMMRRDDQTPAEGKEKQDKKDD